MNSKSVSKGTTPTGRKTPNTSSSLRPPSPKVDLLTVKKATESARPSPSPKQNLSGSLNRKSPSNIRESNFLASQSYARKPYSSHGHSDSFHRHEDGDFSEQASVRSILNDSQYARLKIVVDRQKSEYEHELESIEFQSMANMRSKSEIDDEKHAYAERTLSGEMLVSEMHGEGGGHSFTRSALASALLEETNNHNSNNNRDDCAISDITQEAGYMSVSDRPSPYGRSNNIPIPAVTTLEASSLPSLPDDEFQRLMKMFSEEQARRNAAAAAANDAQEALNARKHVKRSKSGGNEAMIASSTKKTTSQQIQQQQGGGNNKVLSSIPSFNTYKERMARGGADSYGTDIAEVTQQMQQHHDTVDKEVASAFGLQPMNSASTLLPAQSASPVMTASHGMGMYHAASNSYASPAGVSSVYLSRGHTLSRGSGAHVPADKMWSDSSPTLYHSSPLVPVSESPSTSGFLASMLNHQSGSINAAPINRERDSASRASQTAPSRVNSTSDVEGDHPSFTRSSGGGKGMKILETFREAKHYSNLQQQQQQQQQQAQQQAQHVVHVEKDRFTPVESTSISSHSKAADSHKSHHTNTAATHGAIQPQSVTDQQPVKIIRPNIKRTVSVGSDASSVDGLNIFTNVTSHQKAISPPLTIQEPAVMSRDQELKSSYDDLLRRDLLVSPLTAFDDASIGSGWSHGSRRSSASTKHKVHHVVREHRYASSTASQASAMDHSRIAKGHIVSPIKRSLH